MQTPFVRLRLCNKCGHELIRMYSTGPLVTGVIGQAMLSRAFSCAKAKELDGEQCKLMWGKLPRGFGPHPPPTPFGNINMSRDVH